MVAELDELVEVLENNLLRGRLDAQPMLPPYEAGYYRLYLGPDEDYRLIYRVDDRRRKIFVRRIAHRRVVYGRKGQSEV